MYSLFVFFYKNTVLVTTTQQNWFLHNPGCYFLCIEKHSSAKGSVGFVRGPKGVWRDRLKSFFSDRKAARGAGV